MSYQSNSYVSEELEVCLSLPAVFLLLLAVERYNNYANHYQTDRAGDHDQVERRGRADEEVKPPA